MQETISHRNQLRIHAYLLGYNDHAGQRRGRASLEDCAAHAVQIILAGHGESHTWAGGLIRSAFRAGWRDHQRGQPCQPPVRETRRPHD